jgi:hypothetical protein
MYLVKEKINLEELLKNFDFGSGKTGQLLYLQG